MHFIQFEVKKKFVLLQLIKVLQNKFHVDFVVSYTSTHPNKY